MGWRDPNSWHEATPLADGPPAPACAAPGPPGSVTAAPGPPGTPAAALLERLVYVSRAAPGLDTAAVYGIIRGAHAGNAPAGVTGALVFLDGWFVQVLEAPAAGLDTCLARIRTDRRHERLQIRQRERVHARIFPGQPMALRTRACLDPAVLEAFGYRAGFPVAEFPADVLLEFVVQACCRMR